MINSNVVRAVDEALKSHNVKPRTGERLGDTVARALHISGSEAERWLEALSEGCTVEEANNRAGIINDVENQSILTAVARAIGAIMGKMSG